MADPDDGGAGADDAPPAGEDDPAGARPEEPEEPDLAADADDEGASREELRERVESEYDFDDFGPADMTEMSAEEWAVAFDDESWITGEQLLDRVEADLRSRVADREVFAVVERTTTDPPRVVAYSDEGYAVVDEDGSVEGRGTVLRDVKPTVALASMPDYDVPDPPDDAGLPAPEEVPDAGGELGNRVLQTLAGTMLLAGLILLASPLVADMGDATVIALAVGLGFLVTAGFLGLVVANARLSARFRSEQYRERLREAGVAEGDRPAFVPVEDHEFED